MEVTESLTQGRPFADFTCRLCYFLNNANIDIFSQTGRTENLPLKISKHLSLEVTEEDEYPKWICLRCRKSLNTFHAFYTKVEQVQENMQSVLSTVKGTSYNVGETPRIEHIKIEVDVDFPLVSDSKPHIARRVPKKRGRKPRRKASELTPKKKEVEQAIEQVVDSLHEDDSTEDSKEITQNEESTLESVGKQTLVTKDDDASSLEDQDWVDQIAFFNCEEDSADSDHDELWKPSSGIGTRRTRGRSRRARDDSERDQKPRKKRERRERNGVKDEGSDHIDWEDDDEDSNSRPEPKKKKLRITATHGTMPKPRMPPGSRKIVRAQMNAMMVQFYGITCDICINKGGSNPIPVEPIKYLTFEELCDHMQKDHNERGYVKCCNCTMRERKRAERHMLLHTMPGSVYKCNICGKQLSSQQSFRCHILLHLPDSERPYRCTQCERGFVTKADLTQHEHQHLPEEKRFSYTCDICGSRFSYESGLMIHKQRVHENIRTHLCDICAKSFNSRCDMERHREQIHGNVKREQCPECGKWFKGPSILKTHMRQHRGVTYQCQFCEKKYSVRSSWKAHLLRHSDEKPHKCPMCDKAFKLPGTLKMHLNQHTGELPYACPFCPKKFASSGNYYTHRKRMHKEEVAQMKEATEAALAASGLPPPATIPPPTTTQSISQAIARAKAAAAANAAAANPTAANPTAASAAPGSLAVANVAVVSSAVSTPGIPNAGVQNTGVPNGAAVNAVLGNISAVTNANLGITNVVHVKSVVSSPSTVETAVSHVASHGPLNTVGVSGMGSLPPHTRAVGVSIPPVPVAISTVAPSMGHMQSMGAMPTPIRNLTSDLSRMPPDMRVMTSVLPTEIRILTPDLRTISSDMRALTTTDIRTMSSDMRAISTDMRPGTSDMRPLTTMTPDMRPIPIDIRSIPPDMRVVTQDLRGMPQDMRGMAQGMNTMPGAVS